MAGRDKTRAAQLAKPAKVVMRLALQCVDGYQKATPMPPELES